MFYLNAVFAWLFPNRCSGRCRLSIRHIRGPAMCHGQKWLFRHLDTRRARLRAAANGGPDKTTSPILSRAGRLRGWNHAHAWRFALKEALHEDGTVTAVGPTQVVDLLAKFSGNDLTATLSRIERSVRGLTALGTRRSLLAATATNEVLMAAAEMKRLAGQIN